MKDGVYFYIPTTAQKPQKMDHTAECLAAGLHSMGFPLFSNVESPYTTQKDLRKVGRHIYVLEVTDENYSPQLMQAFEQFAVPHKVITSKADRTASIFTPDGISALMTHENKFRRVRGRRIPWGIGLTHRAMRETEAIGPFEEREDVILRNFRPTPNQGVRDSIDLMLLGHLEKHFKIDRSIDQNDKFTSNHLQRLIDYKACLAHGGNIEPNLMPHPYFAKQEVYQKLAQHITYHQPVVIIRWDSWRWYESLAAGCLTFNLDLEKYGLVLPIMPTPWEHYIPIDYEDPKGMVDRLMAERSRWAEIAANGREWVRTHYSPEAAAQRFLDFAAHGILFPD